MSNQQIPISQYVKPQSLMENVPISDAAKNMLLKRGDNQKLIRRTTCYSKLFDVSNQDHVSEYTGLLSDAANNKLEIKFISRHWCEQNKTVFVYVEWGTYLIDKD